MRININHPIFFNKHYYFSKQELGADVKPVLNSEDIEQELFDLYRAGRFEQMFGLSPEETEWVPAQDAIRECFGLSKVGSFNIENYGSVNGVVIRDPQNHVINCSNNQQVGNNIFSTVPFLINFDSLESGKFEIVLHYNVHKTIHQSLIPLLEYYSGDELKHSYSSISETKIDLSQIRQISISFKIPAKDIFTQNSGYYLIKFGASNLAKIEFPRCGLPIGGGIYSFSELLDFCNNLNGNPSKELFSFYKLLKNGVASLWLRDNKEEEGWKKSITKCIDKIQRERQFKINDINSVLKIVSGRTITFPMSEYVSITIEGISSGSILGKQKVNNDVYYFVPWNSTIRGKLVIIITAKNRHDSDIDFDIETDFDIDFDIETDFGSLKTNVSCSQFGQGRNELDFEISVPENQSMGKYNVYFRQGQYIKKTNLYFVVTGEKIQIPISGDCSITMIGICSLKQEPFYIAQTPLTQMQVQGLIEIANENLRPANFLSGALSSARNRDGENGALPVSLVGRGAIADILDNLNISFGGKFLFGAPTVEDLTNALYNGMEKHKIAMLYNQNHQLHPVSLQHPIHSTMLGIYDLLGNVLSYTKSHERGTGHFLAFGTTYRETQQDRLIRKIDSNNVADVGFRPKMVKNYFETGSNSISTEPSELRKHDNSDSGSSYKYYGDFIQPIDFAVYL